MHKYVLCISRLGDKFLVSGSQDCTLKVWKIPKELEAGHIKSLSVIATEHGHEKDINSIVVSPNDKFVASGSQDKTIKVICSMSYFQSVSWS